MHYMFEVYDTGNNRILNQWFSGMGYAVSPASVTTLANGSYTSRVRDYAGA